MHRSVILAAVLASGCAQSLYAIDRDEAARIAALPPEQRGLRMRALQTIVEEEPPPASASPPGQRYDPDDGIHLCLGNCASPREYFLFGTLGIGYALTEATRYDGWMRLAQGHPVHLRIDDGEHMWVPISGLSPELVERSEAFIVSPEEGPIAYLERAPLYRPGMAFDAELGGVFGEDVKPLIGRLGLGGFPIQQLGFFASVVLGPRVYFPRVALEIDFFPVSSGTFQLGVFVDPGVAVVREDDDYRARFASGIGGLVEIALTTRCALRLRAGGSVAFADDSRAAVELSGGLTIY